MNYTLLDLFFKLSNCSDEVFNKYLNVVREHLFDEEDKFLVSSIDSYIFRYNRMPTVDFFIDFADAYNKKKGEVKYKIKNYTEKLDYYYNNFVEYSKKKYRQILSNQVLNSEKAGVDIDVIFSRYNRLLKKLEFKSNDVFIKKDIDNFIDEFKALRDKDESDLIPTLFRFIDSTTGGIGRSDFVLFVSRPQSFKTWTMCQLAVNLSRSISNGKILFFSKEMSKVQILKRILSIVSKVNYEDLKRHRLDDAVLEELRSTVLSELDSEIIIIGKEEDSLYDVNYVRMKIMTYNPDVVIIDGLYLFASTDEWVEHSKISRAFRDMSLRLNVPIIGTLQFSRKGYGRGNIAYSDSYEQDASLFIGIERQEDESGSYTNEVIMSILKARDGKVDVKSSFVFDFSNSSLIEKAITDIVVQPVFKKLDSVSSKLTQKEFKILESVLKDLLKDKFIDKITNQDLKNFIYEELGKDVVVNNNELYGRTSTNDSDLFYYFQIQDYVFRVYVSNYIYLNYYKFVPIKEINLESDDLVVFSSSISAIMIKDFLQEISSYFNRGNIRYLEQIKDLLELTEKNVDVSVEIFERFLKSVFYFKDPLTNLLILLNGNLRFIQIDRIENEYLKSLLADSQYSTVFKYYILNVFYDFDITTKTFYLRDKYLKLDFDYSLREKVFMETLASFTNDDFRKVSLKAQNQKDDIVGDVEVPF